MPASSIVLIGFVTFWQKSARRATSTGKLVLKQPGYLPKTLILLPARHCAQAEIHDINHLFSGIWVYFYGTAGPCEKGTRFAVFLPELTGFICSYRGGNSGG
jgi:hypothetical protein